MRSLRERQLDDASEFILRMEASGVLDEFGHGAALATKNISPSIRFCHSRKEHELFRYCKYFQGVPTTNRVGRQVRALIYDVGQVMSLVMV
jgi:hypothetical protein